MSRFVTQYVLRPQFNGESLSDYIQQVRLHSEMFKTSYSEAQLVEIIVMNSNRPEVRSLYLSSSAPKTFSELFVISTKLNQCDTGELLRTAPSTSQFWQQTPKTKPAINQPQIEYNKQRETHAQSQSNYKSTSQYRPECFYCGKPGHFKRDCWARKKSLKNTRDE